ncbi:tachylectin-related carbohydrate-binding protein [Amycolatopsis halotolerans]|uniref:Tachylectin-related carbohydrate-binding protein n=1 Tax=Amycolatopsis halotolerans TaxID=330083 RepID=A0ABV7QL07_9PSEU
MHRQTTRLATLSFALLTGGTLAAVPANAVSGGTTVPLGTASYLARVSTPAKACSAALIDPSWVITSKGCLTADANGTPTENATVSVGAVDVSTGAGTTAKIVRVVSRTDRDVAVAKLDKPATGITPVPVSTTAPKNGETLQLAGFGRTATEWVPARPSTAAFAVSSVNPTEAAMTSANGADTCLGDSGGPALRTVGDKVEVVAVNSRSWQHGCLAVTETRQGSTEARVDDLADWIRQNTVPTPVSCPNGASIWSVRTDGGLYHYVHNTPVDGRAGWQVPSSGVGSAWFGRTLAGTNNTVWDIHRSNGTSDPIPNGALAHWVWTANGWSDGSVIGSGWQPYLAAEGSNRVTVDTTGRIIVIDPQGQLRFYRWDNTARSWENPNGETIDTGWGRFDSITGAGDGVFYARTPAGALYRFQYDYASHTWLQRDKSAGTGWQGFSELFSPGADIIYGRGSYGHSPFDGSVGPVLRWYRYSPNTDSWGPSASDGGGIPVGTGWNTEIHVTAAPDSCRFVA